MSYATLQDIIDRYGADVLIIAADHDNDGVADTAIVTQGLADASEEIDSYIGETCTLPLGDVPKIIVKLCADMALYHMSLPSAITENRQKRYDDAVKFLKLVNEGKITLGAKTPQGTGKPGAAFFAAPRRFKRGA